MDYYENRDKIKNDDILLYAKDAVVDNVDCRILIKINFKEFVNKQREALNGSIVKMEVEMFLNKREGIRNG